MSSTTHKRRLLGLDPGLRATGWGIVDVAGSRLTHVANGTVTSQAKDTLAERLLAIYCGLESVIRNYAPQEAAIESVFVNRDGQATLKLGQARGVAILAASQVGLEVAEYAPNHIKKSVVGAGHADKRQMMTMVTMLLPSCDPHSEHSVDALAVAITHAHGSAGAARVAAAIGGGSQ
jgi:crossover junction endodeoxyribonuclease RuvC